MDDPIDPIDPGVTVGHVHLKVSDLARAEGFYREVLGFEVTTRFGDSAVFLSAGGYHHHLALNTWQSRGMPPGRPDQPGLYHVALLYPDRPSLARAVLRVVQHGVTIDGVADHLVSESVYLRDPDQNGLELYRDRPRDQWRHDDTGAVVMDTLPLDVEGLLAEAATPPPAFPHPAQDVRDP